MIFGRLFAPSAVTVALFTAFPLAARAQTDAHVTESAAPAASDHGEDQALLGEGWIRYGAAIRSGDQNDLGPGLTYSGTTPNDLALGANYFVGFIGGDLSLQREGFSLNNGSTKVNSGGLIRAAVGPAGRLAIGLFKLDLMVNYGFAQLPSFSPTSASNPPFGTAQRHSLLLASRARFDLPFGALVQADVQYPVSLAVKDGSGQSASSTGFGAGGSIGYRIATTDRIAYVARAEYEYLSDTLSQTGGSSCSAAQPCTSSQKVSRIGLALQLDYLEPPRPVGPTTGGVVVSVVDAATGASLSNVTVDVETGGRHFGLTTAADGKVAQRDLLPGTVTAKATVGGYLPGQGSGEVKPGADAELVVRVTKEPPKTGGLQVTFVDKQTQKPIAGAKAMVRDVEYVADEGGAMALVELQPGPVEIKATAPGYRAASEVGQVVAGQKSPVVIAMVQAEKKQPATIAGLVRSTQTGAPIPATLEIPEAKVKARADEKGSFTFPLGGGTYRVIISAPGYLTQTKTVTVKEGDEVIFNVDLHPVSR